MENVTCKHSNFKHVNFKWIHNSLILGNAICMSNFKFLFLTLEMVRYFKCFVNKQKRQQTKSQPIKLTKKPNNKAKQKRKKIFLKVKKKTKNQPKTTNHQRFLPKTNACKSIKPAQTLDFTCLMASSKHWVTSSLFSWISTCSLVCHISTDWLKCLAAASATSTAFSERLESSKSWS